MRANAEIPTERPRILIRVNILLLLKWRNAILKLLINIFLVSCIFLRVQRQICEKIGSLSCFSVAVGQANVPMGRLS